MKNRLFIVEGVPCTGKSGTAKFVADFINTCGEKSLSFLEGVQGHPAEYDFHAFVTDEDLKKFSKDETEKLLNSSEKGKNGYIITLAHISGDLFAKVIQYKIYDMLPWNKEYPVMLNKWKEFGQMAMQNDYSYIFECCFLQNPLCETMMRFNMKDKEIYDYVYNIYQCIKDLNPVVIYLKNTQIGQRVQEVSKERDKKWLHEVIEYHTSQGYGKAHGYKGFDGYIECLKARQKIELDILDNLNINKIVIENPFLDWNEAHKKIKDFMALLLS